MTINQQSININQMNQTHTDTKHTRTHIPLPPLVRPASASAPAPAPAAPARRSVRMIHGQVFQHRRNLALGEQAIAVHVEQLLNHS